MRRRNTLKNKNKNRNRNKNKSIKGGKIHKNHKSHKSHRSRKIHKSHNKTKKVSQSFVKLNCSPENHNKALNSFTCYSDCATCDSDS